MPDPDASLESFVTYVTTHLTGDEKGEAADYLDHLFRALGHDGIKEAGASRETRVARKGGGKGKNYIDLLWPERVLFEMKSRGQKLERHYDQLFDYWTHIVPHRPPYAILCNFDEFWIYDFNQQLFDPVEKVALTDLPHRAEALAFLLPKPRKPLFNNNRVEVTREAAAELAALFRSIVARGEDRTRAQHFILQLLVTLVSEDMALLPRQILTRLVDECREKGESAYDLIGGLFRQMNTKVPARGGRFTDVPYFNGGLFAEIDPVELQPAELDLLAGVAGRKWNLVKPEIFGTLFQSSMDTSERHAYGAHFTSEFDIQKVVGPTIVRPWRARMAEAWNSMDDLMAVLTALRAFRVLDPACGSGNFLAVAYREMKRMEQDILNRLRELSRFIKVKGSKAGKSVPPEALMNAVSIQQFHGMDVLPFAAELAKVTLMVAKEMWVMENSHADDSESLFARESPLPLDNLDANIRCADALFTDWPKADAIVGNPPYLGSRYIAQELGYDYAKRVQERFPAVPKMADFCTHWFRLAHDALPAGGRAGLVGTNTIRQNEGREASLDHIVAHGGTITDAVSTQVWSGDAAVHVSIVNWVKGEEAGKKMLTTQTGDRVSDPWKIEEVEEIRASLATSTDLSSAAKLDANKKSNMVFVGQYPFHNGFLLPAEEAAEWLADDPAVSGCLRPYLIGRDLVELGKPSRWIIDFGQNDIFHAMSFPRAFERVKATVMPDVLAHAEEEKAKTGKTTTRWTRVAERWWQFRDYQPGTIRAVRSVPRYIACSRVTKRPIFEFVDKGINPDNTIVVFPMADDYSFGIIQSSIHFEWFKARCSTLESRFRYTSNTVFDSFPWPQSPSRKQLEAVTREAVALRQLRREVMAKMNWSLRDLYRTLEEPGSNPLRDAQARLDLAVRAAYGMPPRTPTSSPSSSPSTKPAPRRKPRVNPSPLPACCCPWRSTRHSSRKTASPPQFELNCSRSPMNERSTAGWQIRNGVYPITNVALEPIVARIAAIEGFFVHLSSPKSTSGRVSICPGAYGFERASSGKMTVAKWRESRFRNSYPALVAQVVDQNGRIVADDEMISAARGQCRWTSNEVLEITAWNPNKPHDEDEVLLKILAREIQRFGFIESASVIRPNLILRALFGIQLQAFSKHLRLRKYELDVIIEILKNELNGPGFEYDISTSYEYRGDHPFTSQDLNESFGL